MRYWKRMIAYMGLAVICAGCNASHTEGSHSKDSNEHIQDSAAAANTVDELSQHSPGWADEMIADYLEHTDDAQIDVTKSAGVGIGWMLDRIEHADTATYLIYRLGHDMEDHYATDGWLYIDSSKRKLYEYDVVEDSIRLWRR